MFKYEYVLQRCQLLLGYKLKLTLHYLACRWSGVLNAINHINIIAFHLNNIFVAAWYVPDLSQILLSRRAPSSTGTSQPVSVHLTARVWHNFLTINIFLSQSRLCSSQKDSHVQTHTSGASDIAIRTHPESIQPTDRRLHILPRHVRLAESEPRTAFRHARSCSREHAQALQPLAP